MNFFVYLQLIKRIKIQIFMNNHFVFDKDVAMQAVLYVANKLTDDTKRNMHKIFKILYFADREHLSRYGRSITGDVYIAITNGPVPSAIYDMFKTVRGDGKTADYNKEDLKKNFHFTNKTGYMIKPDKQADLDYLSESDLECLDFALSMCEDKDFKELSRQSHDLAWKKTERNREISIRDILQENNESEDYIDYITNKLQLENAF